VLPFYTTFKDLLFLKKLITPSVLTVLYWLVCISIALVTLFYFFKSFSILNYFGFGEWLYSFITLLITVLVSFISTRIGFELLIVIFNINDSLKKIAGQKTTQTDTTTNKDKQD